MNLIGRVLLIAVCVFTATAWPSLEHADVSKENVLLRTMLTQLHTVFNPIQALAVNGTNTTQSACFDSYYAHQEQINQQTVNDTQACYTKANNAMIAFNSNMNQTVGYINGISENLQRRLANCSLYNTTEGIFNCYVSTFDVNMENLFSLTSQSQLALATISNGYESQIEADRQVCVANVVLINKSNSTTASNGLQTCLFSSSSAPGSNNTNSTNTTTPGNKTNVYYLN